MFFQIQTTYFTIALYLLLNKKKAQPTMTVQVVGAGLPRTGTATLTKALEQLLGGRCYHMSVLPGHPFDLGAGWNQALAGGMPDWGHLLDGYNAAVDWPASMFWRELSAANPDALVLLSLRDSAETWWQSANATILPVARLALAPDWTEGRGLLDLLERFTGSKEWDDPALLMTAYERHNAAVRQAIPAHRLLEWRATDGWGPLCCALGVSVPEQPLPWTNRREEWS
jgi:Sulfotransferase domain